MKKGHKYKTAEIADNVTFHLRDPKNKVIIDMFFKAEGFSNRSEWISHVIEHEVLPNRIRKNYSK